MSSKANDGKFNGIANLFSKDELKRYFIRYLVLISSIEIFVFFICFFSQLEPIDIPFPWKEYFFAAFAIPIAITFLLGIIIISFNTYIFGNTLKSENTQETENNESEIGEKNRFQTFKKLYRQSPVMILLLLLGVSAAIFYKLDSIIKLLGHAGEKAAYYLLILLACSLSFVAIFAVVYFILNYNLRKKKMKYQQQYRLELMEKAGLILLEDNILVNDQGRVIVHNRINSINNAEPNESKVTLLPPIPDRFLNMKSYKRTTTQK